MTGLTDKLHFVIGLPPVADIFDTVQVSDQISMKDYKSMVFILMTGVGATGTATLTINASSDAAAAGAEAIAFNYRRVSATGTSDVPGARTAATTAGFTTTAGSNQIYEIEVSAEDLPDGKAFVALTATEVVNSPVLGAVMAVMGEPRFAGATPKTAIA